MLTRRLALFLALMTPATAAARSTTSAHGFVIDQWTTAEGLPLDHVADVAFTADGFVWIATVEGLIRFDGATLRPMDEAWVSALGSRRIARLVTHPGDGALWIMAEDRAVARYADDELQVWNVHELGGAPLQWRAGPDTIWMWGEGGIYRLDDAPVRVPWEESRGVLRGMAVAFDGAVLFATSGRAVFRAPPDAAPERLGEAHGIDAAFEGTLYTSADGTLFVRAAGAPRVWDGARFVPREEDDRTHCANISRTQPFACPPRHRPESPWRITEDAITHTGREVWRLDSSPGEAVEDPRGNLWVPTQGDGLLRVRPAVLRHLAVQSPDRRVANLWIDSVDRLWVHQLSHWSVSDPEDRRTGAPGVVLGTVPFGFISELAPDRFLFLGRELARVFRFDGHALLLASERPSNNRTACTEARMADGTRVLGGDEGLHTLQDEALVPRGDTAGLRVRALVPLDGGALAVGTKGKGLWVMDAGRDIRPVGGQGPLLVDSVRHLRRDADSLWVSTEEEGLCVVGPLSSGLNDPVWRCFRPGGVVRGVHASEVDERGRTWLSSNVGLWVADTAALKAFAAGGPAPVLLQLGTDAGMVKAEANGPYCGTVARDRAGVLWFPTQDGVVGVEAARFEFPAAPRVHIEPLRFGAHAEGESPLVLEPEQSVHLSWTAPVPEYAGQVVFRVRLGEARWSAPTSERGLTLARLPPGPFRVEVQAGLAGAWGPVASVAGVRRATWYEGPAPWAIAALLAVGLGAGVVRLRTRTLRRRQRALEAMVAERTAEVQAKADALLLRTAQLAEQSARLAELEGLRTRAIVNLHHELRTPLTLVTTGLERLRRPAEPQESVNHERVLRNAGRLQELMGQLADITRLETGELVPRARRLDLRSQAAMIVSRFQGLAAERGVLLSPPPSGPELLIWLDPDILDKIFGNIVHNALKFTPRGGSVTVGLIEAEEFVRVQVDDTGPGVPEHARTRVFERLYQVERGDDRPHEGSGVGLALARELTELCGGEIGNLPREGGGARFWFTLPRGSAHVLPAEVATNTGEAASGEEPTILGPEGAPLLLVVEDHADMRAWFVEELREGFRVIAAADGEQGLARAVELRPSLVISDVMMPKLDGLALARALRERPGAPPVLLISAKVSAVDREVALTVADGWLPKPFSSTALRAEVRRLVPFEPASRGPAVSAAAPTLESDRRLLERMAVTVDARLADESLSVPELARTVGTSERTLHRELARITGVTPSRWIREHRLRRASEMLRRGQYDTVTEVAAAVGMSRAWFTRMYRAWSGHSPGEDIDPARPAQ